MSNDPAMPARAAGEEPAASAGKDETTRRYTRSAVVRIRAAIAAARAQVPDDGVTQDCGPVCAEDAPQAQPEVTQRYADDARARFRAEIASAAGTAPASGRAAARFRLGDNQPRRGIPAPSMLLFAEKARQSAIFEVEAVAPVARVVPPRKAAVRPCDLVGREAGALLFMMPDGALQVLGSSEVRAVAVGIVGQSPPTLVLDVILDWGDADHPADALRIQPTAAVFAGIYHGLTLAEAVAAAAQDLAAAGASTWPPPPAFPGPPWPRFVDSRAFEAAWLALAPDEVLP